MFVCGELAYSITTCQVRLLVCLTKYLPRRWLCTLFKSVFLSLILSVILYICLSAGFVQKSSADFAETSYYNWAYRSVELTFGKGKGLDTCYSATYMSQTRDQQRFTISEVAADWHEPMVPHYVAIHCPR